MIHRPAHGSRSLLRPRLTRLAAAAALAWTTACSGPTVDLAPMDQSGALLYETQRCALCHGADGTSSFWRPGPDLLPNLDSWTVDSLALYLEDPLGFAEGVDRLEGDAMPGYPQLDESTRRRLAEYVLSLGGR